MKKVYLLPAMLLFAGVTFGQETGEAAEIRLKQIEPYTQVNNVRPTNLAGDRAEGDIIIADDFSVSANWSTPADPDGNAWTIGTTSPADVVQYIGGMASTTASNGHAAFNGISLLLNAGTTPFGLQNAVLEYVPTINCTGLPGVTLEFEQRYRAFNSDSCIVEVSGDGGTSWTPFSINQEFSTNGTTFQGVKSINISAVAGGSANVKVRFRWVGSDDQQFGAGYAWMVDDFRLIESWNYEAELITPKFRWGVGGTVWTSGLEYHFIPYEQTSPIEFSGQIQNNGGATQTGAYLNATVAGPESFDEDSPTSNILLTETDSFAVGPTFTPVTEGIYNLDLTADQVNTDVDLTNNSFSTSFEITDAIYGRDNGVEEGGITNFSSNTGLSFAIGNMMEIFADAVVTHMDIQITNESDNVDQVIYGTIYRYDATDDDYLQEAVTEEYVITSSDLGNVIRIPMFNQENFDVFAGDDLLVMAAHFGGDPAVEFATAQPIEFRTVRGVSDDGSIGSLTSPSAIMVRLVMPDDLSVEGSDEAFGINVSQNQPNPFTNNTVITYSLNEASNVTLDIVDVTGKLITSINEGSRGAGEHKVVISGAELSDGVYFYNFKAGNYSVTKRMVVTK
ncbi:MAG: T9SS type A sorting domain-containing protein [Crocinitomicaceae bacterium]